MDPKEQRQKKLEERMMAKLNKKEVKKNEQEPQQRVSDTEDDEVQEVTKPSAVAGKKAGGPAGKSM